jgi:hypothetical protein
MTDHPKLLQLQSPDVTDSLTSLVCMQRLSPREPQHQQQCANGHWVLHGRRGVRLHSFAGHTVQYACAQRNTMVDLVVCDLVNACVL